MAVNIGILTERDQRGEQFLGTRRYEEEIRQLGHNAVILDYVNSAIGVTEEGIILYQYDDEDKEEPLKPVEDIDVVIPNIDMYVDEGLLALRALMSNGIPSTHDPDSIALSHDKFRCHMLFECNGIPTPYSAMPLSRLPQQPNALLKLVQARADDKVVIKHNEGARGIGVMRADSRTSARSVVEGLDIKHQPYILQEYVGSPEPGAVHSDERLVVVNGEVVAGMKRTAGSEEEEDEFRAGISSGGTGTPFKSTPHHAQLALRVAEITNARFVAVDFMDSRRGALVNEINVFPGFAIEQVTGVNIAREVVAYAMQLFRQAHPQKVAEEIMG